MNYHFNTKFMGNKCINKDCDSSDLCLTYQKPIDKGDVAILFKPDNKGICLEYEPLKGIDGKYLEMEFNDLST